MKPLLTSFAFAVFLVTIGHTTTAKAQESAAQAAAEKSIRAAAQAFVEAFNRSDADAVAAHWTADGIYVDEEGNRFLGRKLIQQEYAKLFRSNSGVRMNMEIDSVRESGTETSSGLQVIGVDPSSARITSWTFTSDGGHAIGICAPHEKGWIVETSGATKEGTATSATNILSRSDNGALVWKSLNRTVGESTLPDIEEVVLTRN